MTTVNLVNPFWGRAFTYWRFTPLSVQAPLSQVALTELALASTPGGANLLASAVSVTAPGATFVTRLYDGLFVDITNAIGEPSRIPSNEAYVQAQFAAPVSVAEVRISAGSSPSALFSWALAGSSDGVNWVGFGVYTSGAFSSNETKTFAIGPRTQNGGRAGSRVWLFQRNVGSAGRIRIRELVYATSAGGAQLATGGSAFAKGTNEVSGPVERAFDGNLTSTDWVTTAGSTWQYAAYYFPTAPNPTHYRVTAASSDFPSDWVVYYLSNCADWVAADTRSGESGWSASETRTYTMAA